MIYFIRAGDRIKIGYCKADPEARLRTFQTAHYEKLTLLSVHFGDRKRETEIHRQFKEHRAGDGGREWFTADASIVAFASTHDVRSSFYDWLMALPDTDDPRGDFVGDVRNDSRFPKDADGERADSYLRFRRAIPEAMDEFRKLWKEYSGADLPVDDEDGGDDGIDGPSESFDDWFDRFYVESGIAEDMLREQLIGDARLGPWHSGPSRRAPITPRSPKLVGFTSNRPRFLDL